MGKWEVALSTVVLGVAGCHLIFPYEGPDACTTVDVPAGCWDVKARFTAATSPVNWDALKIFGEQVQVDEERAELLRSGDPQEAPTIVSQCASVVNFAYYQAWFIAREQIGPDHYKIVVRGNASKSCAPAFDPLSAGTITANATRGWKMQEIRCATQLDYDKLVPNYCAMDAEGSSYTWQSSCYCHGCCACQDGARVEIDLDLVRQR